MILLEILHWGLPKISVLLRERNQEFVMNETKVGRVARLVIMGETADHVAHTENHQERFNLVTNGFQLQHIWLITT